MEIPLGDGAPAVPGQGSAAIAANADSIVYMDASGETDAVVPAAKESRLMPLNDAVPDLPEPTLALPADVVVIPERGSANFKLGCKVDLKLLNVNVRNCEYNPRVSAAAKIRLLNPRATTIVRPSGCVAIHGGADPEELKHSARRVARLVQKSGHEEASCKAFKVSNSQFKADLRFPVRLETLARKWQHHAFYEPEVNQGCIFRMRRPPCTLHVFASGKVVIHAGSLDIKQAQEAVRIVYPLFSECQH